MSNPTKVLLFGLSTLLLPALDITRRTLHKKRTGNWPAL